MSCLYIIFVYLCPKSTSKGIIIANTTAASYNSLFFTANPCSSTLLVKPEGGEEVVYAPAGQNATLMCTVNGSTLVWDVDELRFAESTPQLHRRGIFENRTSQGFLNSTLTVYGSDLNDQSNICCFTRKRTEMNSLDMCCIRLHVYGQYF